MLNFQYYFENRDRILMEQNSPESAKALRDIQFIVNQQLNQTLKRNGFGIDEIRFEPINEETAKEGIQLNMEAKGLATANNKEQVSRFLQKLMADCREPLWQKKIFLEIHYHQINVQGNTYESTDTLPKLYFTVVCAAIVFT